MEERANVAKVNLKELQKLMTEGFKNFNVDNFKGKDIVLLMGTTGSGKSTCINYLKDPSQMVCHRHQKIDVALGASNPKIGHRIGDRSSQTIFPEAFNIMQDLNDSNNNNSIIFCDTPGFNHNGTLEEELALSTFMEKLFRMVKSVKIILVMDYRYFSDMDRAEKFVKISKLLKKLFKDIEDIKSAIMVVLTRAPVTSFGQNDSGATTIEVEEFLQEYLLDLDRKLTKTIREGSKTSSECQDMAKQLQIINLLLFCAQNNKLIPANFLDKGLSAVKIMSCISQLKPISSEMIDIGQFNVNRNKFLSNISEIVRKGSRYLAQWRQAKAYIEGYQRDIEQKRAAIASNNATNESTQGRLQQRETAESQMQLLEQQKQGYNNAIAQATNTKTQLETTNRNLTLAIQEIENDPTEDLIWSRSAPNLDPGFLAFVQSKLSRNPASDALIHMLGSMAEFVGVNVRTIHTFDYDMSVGRPIRVVTRRADGALMTGESLRPHEELNVGTIDLANGIYRVTYKSPFAQNPDMHVDVYIKHNCRNYVRQDLDNKRNEREQNLIQIQSLERTISLNQTNLNAANESIRNLNGDNVTSTQMNQEIIRLRNLNSVMNAEISSLQSQIDEKKKDLSKWIRKIENGVQLFDCIVRILNCLPYDSKEEEKVYRSFITDLGTFYSVNTLFIYSTNKKSVQTIHVAGGMNGWLEARDGKISVGPHPAWQMRKLKDGTTWVLAYPLLHGEYSFKYVINSGIGVNGGSWEIDNRFNCDGDGNSIVRAGSLIPGKATLDVFYEELFKALSNWGGGLEEPQISKSDMVKLNEIVNKWGYRCHPVPGDRKCFWHAALHQLKNGPVQQRFKEWTVEGLIAFTVRHIRDNHDRFDAFIQGNLNDFLDLISAGAEEADYICIKAFTEAFCIDIIVINSDNTKPIVLKAPNSPITIIYLGYEVEKEVGVARVKHGHYNSLVFDSNLVPTQTLEQYIQSFSNTSNNNNNNAARNNSRRTKDKGTTIFFAQDERKQEKPIPPASGTPSAMSPSTEQSQSLGQGGQ